MRKLILSINGAKEKWSIPDTANDISFHNGLEIARLLDKRKTQANVCRVLELALGCSGLIAQYLLKNREADVLPIYLDIKDMFEKAVGSELTTFAIDREFYRRKHVGDLTVGEFIEFEKCMSSDNPEENMFISLVRGCKPSKRMLFASVFRNKLIFYTGLEQPFRGITINGRGLVKNVPYSFGVITVYKMIEELNGLVAEFPSVFKSENKNLSTFDDAIFGEFECEEENDESGEAKYNKWAWYGILDRICNADVIQKDVWRAKPIKELLTYISYLSEEVREQISKGGNYGR